MATVNSAIRKAHDDILRPFDAEAKWTIITAARGFRIEEHEGTLKEFDGKQLREGDLSDFIEEFQNFDPPGSMLFAPIKIKVQNSQPKCALLQWYAPDAIPKSYFIGQCQTLQKLLPGFTVPIDIRDRDSLTADDILQKVGGAAPQRDTARPPPPANKPTVFRPIQVAGGGGGFNARARAPQGGNEDNDGWGADAPQVSRSQLEKVESAYKPTKVDLGQMRSQQEPSRFSAPARDDSASDGVVRGGYQPIGKVDIAAIRRQAKEGGSGADDRPTTVKGAYEPVGKVDIAAIRAKAQGPGGAASPASHISPSGTGASAPDDEERPKSLAERSAAFHQSERLTSLPKPKVHNKFGAGAGAGSFSGTKAPAPAGFGPKPAAAAPVGIASRTFADEGGKTPAQIWAEKKARQGGASPTTSSGFGTQPATIASQASGDGGWKSGYAGKSWATVNTTHTGKSAASDLSAQRTGQQEQEQEAPSSPSGGVGAIRDRFKNAAPISMGAPAPPRAVPESRTPSPPPTNLSSKPNVGGPRGVPMPGLPPRPAPTEDYAEEEQDYPDTRHEDQYDEEEVAREQTQRLPPPPAQPRSPSPPTPDEMRSGSPIRVAMPVARGGKTDLEPAEQESGPPLPSRSIAQALPDTKDIPDEPGLGDDEPGRATAQATAGAPVGTEAYSYKIVTAIFDHESDPNDRDELDLQVGDAIFDIEIKDKDSGWWWGTNEKGQRGTFPENYVTTGKTALAQFDFDGEDEGELSFRENGLIVDIEDKGDGWSYGRTLEMEGSIEAEGLFPSDYIVFRE